MWSENTHCVISILLNLLRYVLQLRIWPTLVTILCALKKKVYSAVWGRLSYKGQTGLFGFSGLLYLVFCLLVLVMMEKGVLNSPTIIGGNLFFSFNPISFCYILKTCCSEHTHLRLFCFSGELTSFSHTHVFLQCCLHIVLYNNTWSRSRPIPLSPRIPANHCPLYTMSQFVGKSLGLLLLFQHKY